MTSKIPATVVHYGQGDPRVQTGGVETFARNLGLAFESVEFMTPETLDVGSVVERRLPVVCDNQWVLDWPEHVPVIGFQHGFAAKKALVTRSLHDAKLGVLQLRAARRKNTLWVACAEWISRAFARFYGNRAEHVVYHPVDLERFDGKLRNAGSKLLLHDGRSPHKGSRLYPVLERAFRQFSFEPLACKPADVPERMRSAAAFLHLSRYEGNSIVCNEAMAMDLPCLFTRVGLMLDRGQDFDVHRVPVADVFGSRRRLVRSVGSFLASLNERSYHPRRWPEQNASLELNVASWRRVIDDLDRRWARRS
jgi:glycosyltransferase involved in cell wall biosynthesis